jgi:membrane protein required for colicin V production
MEITALGWLNRMSGAILYALLISMVYSIFLWLLTRMNFLSPETIAASHTYPVMEPLAPKIMAGIGKVIPLFKDGFRDLNNLFEKLNQHISRNVGAH